MHSSLVKYSTPVLVSVAAKKPDQKSKKDHNLPPLEKGIKDSSLRIEDILNQIIPPKEFVDENGQLKVQTVLSTPAKTIEISTLKNELERKLQQNQARETGICPIREELYDQCFDELIRQITIDCKQRGILLVNVRDEFRNQIEAYKSLYESSIAYGMRKMIESEQKKTDMQNKIIMLERETNELNQFVDDMTKKIHDFKQNETEKLEKENNEHLSEVKRIKEEGFKIKDELDKILSGRR